MPKPIYMDHHATTPVHPEVVEAMLPYFTEEFGNASSVAHVYGRKANEAVEVARRAVAHLIGASPGEIVFTSGATESINIALRGACGRRDEGAHLITSAIEHEAVLETARALEDDGVEVTVLPVDRSGLIDPAEVLKAITPRTRLISIQTANNEIGTIQDIAEIGRIAGSKGILFHTDAAQAAGRIPLDVAAIQADLVSFSAHKMYGPKGIGALFVRRGVSLHRTVTGGGQEKNRRSGTLNVPAIAGFGAAARIAERDMIPEGDRLRELRDRLWRRLESSIDQIVLNGHPTRRLPNNLNVTFRHVEGEALLMALRDVAALSSGSACASGAMKGSHVIRALGADEESAHSSIRFGLGRGNTREQVDLVADRIESAVARLRAISPSYRQGMLEGAGGSNDL